MDFVYVAGAALVWALTALMVAGIRRLEKSGGRQS